MTPNDPMKLYYMPGTCALAIHIVLEWSAAPYTAVRISPDELKSPEYLALNPSGVVPTLVEGEQVLTEASAILLALCRRFPALGPGPEAGEAARFDFERYVIYLGGTLHPHFWPWFGPDRYGAKGGGDRKKIRAAAEALLAKDFAWLDGELGDGPYFMGERRTAADAYLYPMARWGFGLSRPVATYPNIDRFMRLMARDEGVRRASEAQGLPPLY